MHLLQLSGTPGSLLLWMCAPQLPKRYYDFVPNIPFHFPRSPTVHLACPDGHSSSDTTRQTDVAIRHAADSAQTHRPGHQHPAAGHRQGSGHSVAAARFHQVIQFSMFIRDQAAKLAKAP